MSSGDTNEMPATKRPRTADDQPAPTTARGMPDADEHIRHEGMVVDKSVAIRDIMNREEPIVAGLYPHRMGKSMFLDLLADFLAAVSNTPYSVRRARYEQYDIYQEDPEFFNSNMGRHVVFRLDLERLIGGEDVDVGAHDIAVVRERLRVHRRVVVRAFKRFDRLDNVKDPSWNDLFDICDMIPTLMEVFYLLFDCKAVAIVNGCDAPFLDTIQHTKDQRTRQELLEEYKGFFDGILEDNPHLHKGILAGVFDVRSTSMESVFNSIPTFLAHTGYTDNITNPFQRAFGFTVQDVWAVINQYVDQLWPARNSCTDVDEFKARVFAGLLLQSDGYRIGAVHRIFCPFSVMTFLKQLDQATTDRELAFDNQPSEQNELGYSDDTEAELVRICTVDSSGLIDELLRGERFSAATVVQVLYQTGYLAPVAQHRMGIPSKATYDK
ncbi:hypothetical protein IWQ56_000792, partial [Coemansia nantahalensis]